MSADVTVLGLMVPTCLLGDIAMDVPHGQVVVIPADKALRSKDLWRCIGQKLLFRMQGGPGRPYAPVGTGVSPDVLLSRTENLEEESRQLRSALAAQTEKLDAILSLLQSGTPWVAGPQASGAHVAKVSAAEVVASEAPTFIPSAIAPQNAETRIEPRESEGESVSVLGAAEKLRELRQKGKQ